MNQQRCCEKCLIKVGGGHKKGDHSDDFKDTEPCYCDVGRCGNGHCPCHTQTTPSHEGKEFAGASYVSEKRCTCTGKLHDPDCGAYANIDFETAPQQSSEVRYHKANCDFFRNKDKCNCGYPVLQSKDERCIEPVKKSESAERTPLEKKFCSKHYVFSPFCGRCVGLNEATSKQSEEGLDDLDKENCRPKQTIHSVFPKQSSGIEEVVAEFDFKFKHVHHLNIIAENIIRDPSEIHAWLRTTLTYFESRIRAEEREEVRDLELNSPEWKKLIEEIRTEELTRIADLIEGEIIECADTATAQIRNDALRQLKKKICA